MAAIGEARALARGAPKDQLLLMCGDANGCPGGEPTAGVTGPHVQGRRTAGGEHLLEFATELELRVSAYSELQAPVREPPKHRRFSGGFS